MINTEDFRTPALKGCSTEFTITVGTAVLGLLIVLCPRYRTRRSIHWISRAIVHCIVASTISVYFISNFMKETIRWECLSSIFGKGILLKNPNLPFSPS